MKEDKKREGQDEKEVIAVIGGGPAGILAAIEASKSSKYKVYLIERNNELGKKLKITGGGRCNITSSIRMDEFYSKVVGNEKFLIPSFNNFTNDDLIKLVTKVGIEVEVDKNTHKVFLKDNPQKLIEYFSQILIKNGVTILYSRVCEQIELSDDGFIIKLTTTKGKKNVYAKKLICATGGYSYPKTGSDGLFMRVLEDIGIKHTKILPALTSIKIDDPYLTRVPGISLDTRIWFKKKRVKYDEIGPIVVTHTGISGPNAMDASSFLNKIDDVNVRMDLIPNVPREKIEKDINDNKKKSLIDIFSKYCPQRLVANILGELDNDNIGVSKSNIGEISKKDIDIAINIFKERNLNVVGLGSIENSIVTSGGIGLKRVDPKTLESKDIKGLYFCGEVLDIDCLTGGFNLQVAFSTGFLAGKSASTF